MRLRWGLYLAFLTAPVIGASTIDVSTDTSAVLHTGDTLVFQLLSWNFAVDAPAFGLPAYPAEANFALVSSPLCAAGVFTTTPKSEAQYGSEALGGLACGSGYFLLSGDDGGVHTSHA